MAQKRTEKSNYESRFGSGWITGAQWLAENMCSRKARSQGSDLPKRFWDNPYWKKELLLQLRHANELLKEYDVKSIVAVLKKPDANKIYSLGLKSVLIPLLEKEKSKNELVKNQQIEKIHYEVDVNQKPRKPFGNKKAYYKSLGI